MERSAESKRTAETGWLLLTDLHAGQPQEGGRLEQIEEEFLKDLERVSADEKLVFNLVFFSGDIAFRGSDSEFIRATAFLGRILRRIEDLNRNLLGADGELATPLLIPAPGNHDLARPSQQEAESVRGAFAGRTAASTALWPTGLENIREIIDRAFAGYERWLRYPLPFPPRWRSGVVPGDRVATVDRGGIRVGILSLNGAYLHLADGCQGALHLDGSQVTALCPLIKWKRDHDFTVLLTHHPPSWFSPSSQEMLNREILAGSNIDLHLFGHDHVGRHLAQPGSTGIRHMLQGRSLFAAEQGESGRLHGYTVGRFLLNNRGKRMVEIQPRSGWVDDSGWRFGPVRDDGPGSWHLCVDLGEIAQEHRAAKVKDTRVTWNRNLGNLDPSMKLEWAETYAGLKGKLKRTKWVFLSASLPTARGDADRRKSEAKYVETARPQEITQTIRELAKAIKATDDMGIVFGGHPSITQMLAPLVMEPGHRDDPWLLLFQHEQYWHNFVEDVGVIAWMDGVACVLTRHEDARGSEEGLTKMRVAMLEVKGLVAAVFVGGLSGVRAEYKLVEGRYPDIRRFAVGIGGGAASELLLREGRKAAGYLPKDSNNVRKTLPKDTAPLWYSPKKATETIIKVLTTA